MTNLNDIIPKKGKYQRKEYPKTPASGIWVGEIKRVGTATGCKVHKTDSSERRSYWTLYFVDTEDGECFTTFDETFGALAQAAVDSESKVEIAWEYNGDKYKGRSITSLEEYAGE